MSTKQAIKTMKHLLFLISSIILTIQSSYAQSNQPICPSTNLQWLPHQTDCSRYYVCRQGELFERSCAPGLLFNNDFGFCTFPQFSQCSLSCPVVEDPGVLVFLPDFKDCSKFFICDSGRAVARSCAEGLRFDTENNWCDLPEKVACESRGNGNIIDNPGSPTPDMGPPPPPPTTLRTTRSPDAGEPTTSWESNTTTRDSLTTSNINRFECPVEPGPLYFHHTVYCNRFFLCINGISYLRSCPSGTVFDYTLRNCIVDGICYSSLATTTEPAT